MKEAEPFSQCSLFPLIRRNYKAVSAPSSDRKAVIITGHVIDQCELSKLKLNFEISFRRCKGYGAKYSAGDGLVSIEIVYDVQQCFGDRFG